MLERLHMSFFIVVDYTLVSLIPESPTATTMKDMRQISYFTTLYKILSKVLTTKLSKVINEVVDDSQSTFLPGKVILDWIGYRRKLTS